MKKFIIFLLMISCCFTASIAQSSASDLKQLYDRATDYYTGNNGAFLNKEKAFELFKQAAEGGFVPAMKRLSVFYGNGEVVDKNMTMYFTWLLKAAQAGDDVAQNSVGVCYYDGTGTPQNIEQSFHWFKCSAEQGNVDAMSNLHILYDKEGITSESLKWMRSAAEHGHVQCQYDLGKAYYNGNGVKKDIEQAIYWYLFAGENGNAGAFAQLGYIYHEEKDVKDYSKSFYYTQKAYEMGSKNAIFNLAYNYEFGHGTDVDYKLAEQYYLQAISTPGAPIEKAKYRLGMIYYEGKGTIKKDKKKGRKLLKEAAEKGHEKAKEYLEKNKETWTITVNGEKAYEKVN